MKGPIYSKNEDKALSLIFGHANIKQNSKNRSVVSSILARGRHSTKLRAKYVCQYLGIPEEGNVEVIADAYNNNRFYQI
ncbi:MAG: hypothetical protein IT245_03205 [Bacteroidia bacterium]|nr:hypothetical protein [Bacteroidia bacterium]